jgi:hypothetical protein
VAYPLRSSLGEGGDRSAQTIAQAPHLVRRDVRRGERVVEDLDAPSEIAQSPVEIDELMEQRTADPHGPPAAARRALRPPWKRRW